MFASSMLGPVHRNARDCEQKLRAVEQRLSEAAARELDLEQRIAVKLSELAGLQLDQTASLEQEARRVLTLREDEEKALRARLDVAERTISGLLEKIDACQATIRAARKRAADFLAAHAEFNAVLARHAAEQERQRTSAPATRELQQECARKLAQYRQDERYAYLVRSGYGSSAYQRGGVLRALDSWIARLCNYAINRRNELTLLGMQQELAQTAAADQQRLEALDGELAEIRAAAERSAGLDEANAELARLQQQAQAEKRRANDIHAELSRYAEKSDVRYRQARSVVAVTLQSNSPEELLARVRRTPGASDDALADEVIALQAELKRQHARSAALDAERAAAGEQYQRAKELERALRDSGYAGGRYRYHGGLDMASLIIGYMAGRITMDQAAREIAQHRYEIEDDYPYQRTGGWGRSGDDGWPGGFGSGGFGTSDSSGGGGFNTSDSF